MINPYKPLIQSKCTIFFYNCLKIWLLTYYKMFRCNHINNENIKSFNQNDFFYKNEMFDAIKTKDKRSLSPILPPTSPVKLKKYLTETSISK